MLLKSQESEVEKSFMVRDQKKGQTTCPNGGIWELDVTSALKAFHF